MLLKQTVACCSRTWQFIVFIHRRILHNGYSIKCNSRCWYCWTSAQCIDSWIKEGGIIYRFGRRTGLVTSYDRIELRYSFAIKTRNPTMTVVHAWDKDAAFCLSERQKAKSRRRELCLQKKPRLSIRNAATTKVTISFKWKQYRAYTEANPGFSEKGLGQTSAYII